METVPPELLARMPLDCGDLAALAQTSKAMLEVVSAARCIRGVTVRHAFVGALNHPRYRTLTALCVKGPFVPRGRTPPLAVPRPMPFLTSLHALDCWPNAHWSTVVDHAPTLRELVVFPVFTAVNYPAALQSCLDLMTQAARLPSLWKLEIRGTGSVVWGDGWNRVRGAGLSGTRQAVLHAPPVSVTARHVAITGHQFFPALDGPFESAELEEPHDATMRMLDRLGGRARATLRDLTWSAPSFEVARKPFPPGLDALRRVRMRMADIRCPTEFQAVLEALQFLPPGLEDVHLFFDISKMAGTDPRLPLKMTPLAHLAPASLTIGMSFATRGSGDLLSKLLGARPDRLTKVTLRADTAPGDTLRAAARAARDKSRETSAAIFRLEQACYVTDADKEAMLAAFPRVTHLKLLQFVLGFSELEILRWCGVS